MSDSEMACTSCDSDSEGSLADFIVHDSDEEVMNGSEVSEKEDEDSEDSEDEDAHSANAIAQAEQEAKDADMMVCEQYTSRMETEGSVMTDMGLRRSARTSKGCAPARYVDEDYVGLMTEDVSDIEWESSDEDEKSCE